MEVETEIYTDGNITVCSNYSGPSSVCVCVRVCVCVCVCVCVGGGGQLLGVSVDLSSLHRPLTVPPRPFLLTIALAKNPFLQPVEP